MYLSNKSVASTLTPTIPLYVKQNSLIHSLVNGVRKDEKEFLNSISLTAYENRMSKLCQSFLSTDLCHRYHLGAMKDRRQENQNVVVSGDLMFQGLPGIYALEKAAQTAAQEMFSAAAMDFRPLSGVHAMLCTLASITEPGDLVYSIAPMNGGHFATKQIIERLGRRSRYLPWHQDNFSVDWDLWQQELKAELPKAIFLDLGAMLFRLPIAEIRELVGDRVSIVYDASHPLGLIAGGQFQNPLAEGCDILQGNTHKTFPGPQKGIILFRDRDLGDRIINSISSGLVSSQHTHHAVALYLATLEMQKFGKAYAQQTIGNAQILGRTLSEFGFNVVQKQGIHTNSNVILLEGMPSLNAYDMCRQLMACGLSSNARNLYQRTILRLGTQEITRRGMKEREMKQIAELFKRLLLDRESANVIQSEVRDLNERFPNIHYSFDREFGYWE
jgi:glycine/serine hydroxymethyltransferase